MKVRQQVSSSLLGLGMGAMAFTGMGTAAAAPGAQFSGNGNDPVGFGDNTEHGAQAFSSTGNNALAVSVFAPSRADVSGKGTGNTAIAIDGVAGVVGKGSNNTVIAVGGGAVVNGGNNNRVLAVGGVGAVDSGVNNNVTALGSNVMVPGKVSTQTVVALCGGSLVAAQSDKVTVSSNCGN